MSNPCTASTCLNGNCPGCRNGVQNCFDPRCYPKCPGCNVSTTSNTNWIIIVIILGLLAILLILSFIIGYDWYMKGKKAGEPKNVTINKHVHNVKPPSVVVSSPNIAPSYTVPIEKNVYTSPIKREVYTSPINNVSNLTNKNPISSEGINLSLEGLPQKSYTKSFSQSPKIVSSKIEGFE